MLQKLAIMLQKLDDFLLDRVFQHFSDWFQITIMDVNCFWWGRLCSYLWVVMFATGLALANALNPLVGFLLSILVLLEIQREKMSREIERALSDSRNINPNRMNLAIFREIMIMVVCFMGLIMGLIPLLSGKWALAVLALAYYFLSASYSFESCTPRPKGKIKKLVPARITA